MPKYILPLTKTYSSEDPRKLFIIGDGPAGMNAAETLRKVGYTGRIEIFTTNEGSHV